MAHFGATFDATAVEPNKPYDPLPPNRYVVEIVASELRATKDGQGQYLWLELDVLDGEHQGRKLFDRLNLVNANPTTVEIAQRTLSAICHAVGKMQVQDSEELHHIPLLADVRVRPSKKEEYGPSNTIRYLPLEQPKPPAAVRPAVPARPAFTPAAAPATAPVVAPTPAPKPAGLTPPWRRSA